MRLAEFFIPKSDELMRPERGTLVGSYVHNKIPDSFRTSNIEIARLLLPNSNYEVRFVVWLSAFAVA